MSEQTPGLPGTSLPHLQAGVLPSCWRRLWPVATESEPIRQGSPAFTLWFSPNQKVPWMSIFFSFLGDSKNKSLWATGGFWWLKLILQKESLLVKNTYGNVKRLVRIHLPPSKANCSGHPWVSMRRYFAPRVPCCSSHTFPRTCSFVPAEC